VHRIPVLDYPESDVGDAGKESPPFVGHEGSVLVGDDEPEIRAVEKIDDGGVDIAEQTVTECPGGGEEKIGVLMVVGDARLGVERDYPYRENFESVEKASVPFHGYPLSRFNIRYIIQFSIEKQVKKILNFVEKLRY